jgi:hypothetical protein
MNVAGAGIQATSSVLRTPVHMETPPHSGAGAATLRTMRSVHLTKNRGAEPSPQVVGLIDRIKRLVAEQRRLDEEDPGGDRRDAIRREISRLKWRLANVVKRELSPGPGLQPALALRR